MDSDGQKDVQTEIHGDPRKSHQSKISVTATG